MNTTDLHSALVNVVLAVLAVIPPLMAAVVIPWVRARVGDQRLRTAATMAERVVRMIEQTQEGDASKNKFRDAATRLKEMAAAKGITLTADEQQTLIEAAVQDLRISWQSVNAPPLPALTPTRRTPARRTPAKAAPKRAPAKEKAA